MIQHIVLFKLKGELPKEEKGRLLEEIRDSFEHLSEEIKVLRKLKIRKNFNPQEEYDFQLIAILERLEDLRTYAEHPSHMALVDRLIKPNVEKRAAVDVWASDRE